MKVGLEEIGKSVEYKDNDGWKGTDELRIVLCTVSCHNAKFLSLFFLVPDNSVM